MINKKIHFIWLGNNKRPNSYYQSIQSCEKFAKDFDIIEWNDSNIDEFDLPKYFYYAIKYKKYAFASDVLRCHVLYKYGGIYMDVDQILLKDINCFLENKFFTAYFHERKDYFGFQFLGAEKNHQIIKSMIDYYNNYNFLRNGFVIINVVLSEIINNIDNKGDICIYDQKFFYPSVNNITTEAYTYHIGNVSWTPRWKKLLLKLPFYQLLKKLVIAITPQSIRRIIGFNIKYE